MAVEQKVTFADTDAFADGVRKELMERVTRVVYERTLPLVPVGTGPHKRGQDQRRLKDRMEMRVGTGGGYGVVKANAPHAHLVVKGTKAHVIRRKQSKALAFTAGGRAEYATVIQHPGSKANDFLTAGLKASADALAVAASQGDILARVKR